MIRKPTPAKINKWEKARKVKKLIKLNQSNDEYLCKLAEDALKNVLTSCRKDLYKVREDRIRIKAVKILGKLKDFSSASDLRTVLSTSHGRLRILIIWALGELRDPNAVKQINRELFYSKWGINPNSTLCGKAEQALKKINTMESRNSLSWYKRLCKGEQEARGRGQGHTCPLCKTYISPYAIGCHKCKKVYEKPNWIFAELDR